MELMNKVVIITGAGTGVGRAAAIKLAAEGAKVVINYNQSEKEAHKVVNEIKQNGGIAIAYKANVANEKEVKELVSQTVQTFGSIDGLVNNASITAQIAMDDLDAVTDDIWDSLFNVNVKGMFYCIKAVVPYMKKQHFGAIVWECSRNDWDRFVYPICSNKICYTYDDKVIGYRIGTFNKS